VSRTLFSRTTFRSSCCTNRFRSRQHLRQWRSARRVLRVHRLLRTVAVVRMIYPRDAVRARAATSARTKPYESYHGLCMLVVLSAQPVVSKSQLGVAAVAAAATPAAKLTAAAATAAVNALLSLLICSLPTSFRKTRPRFWDLIGAPPLRSPCAQRGSDKAYQICSYC